MTAHILFNKIDSQNPASFSKIIITDILRNQLDFKGVVITDDLTMGAIAENYEIGQVAVKAINAGSDIVLVCHGVDNEITVLNSIKDAVIKGEISKDRIDESLYRILSLKMKYNMNNDEIKAIDIDKINQEISSVIN
jgi:beta-N-acetylhexosaminidase